MLYLQWLLPNRWIYASSICHQTITPAKNVVALCGDGGFMMSIQAIVTAVRESSNVVLLWDDDHFGPIKWKQEAHYNKSSHVELKNDLAKLAESFGCLGLN